MQTPDAVIARQNTGPVGWLELFYDLVFVSAVVTFSDAISFEPNLGRIGAVDAAFAAMWLIWLATTIHPKRYRHDGGVPRALVLALDVAVMYARAVHGNDDGAHLARVRRNQYGIAALPIALAALTPEGPRVALWLVGLALLAWPTLGFRFGRLGAVPPFDEHHFVERLGLLTIIVCGESFVKVSLLAADGSLDGIDLAVLVTMFVFVFGVWWGYFDDVPKAGIRPEPIRTAGWLVGHLVVQLALVASAVGYAKVLGYELGTTLTEDKSLLLTMPLVGVLLGLALIGVCSRREPQRALVVLRLGVAAAVAVGGVITWRVEWVSADGGAAILACTALGYAALATRLLRRTHV